MAQAEQQKEQGWFENLESLNRAGFAYRDMVGQDKWTLWTPSVSLTVLGTPTYVGRYRIVGKQCFFQFTAVSTISISTTAGTSYVTLPLTSTGLGGIATMTDDATNIAVGTCHIDVTNNRVYPPTQAASADRFIICGWFEI